MKCIYIYKKKKRKRVHFCPLENGASQSKTDTRSPLRGDFILHKILKKWSFMHFLFYLLFSQSTSQNSSLLPRNANTYPISSKLALSIIQQRQGKKPKSQRSKSNVHRPNLIGNQISSHAKRNGCGIANITKLKVKEKIIAKQLPNYPNPKPNNHQT